MDLQLAAYKADKYQFIDPPKSLRALFPRKRIKMLPDSRGTLDLIAKQLRDSTWRRHESHEKQLKYHLDRERFMQNKTWQQEYDNLLAVLPQDRLQYTRDRMDKLKNLMGLPAIPPPIVD